MSHPVHVLVVRAACLSWAIPMDSVEQAFESGSRRVHDVAGSRMIVFRERALDGIGSERAAWH